ncbi:M20/M25/M40 family metallo-hydrolase [Bacteroidota bacterium]
MTLRVFLKSLLFGISFIFLIVPYSRSQEYDLSHSEQFEILADGAYMSAPEILSRYIKFQSYSGNEKEAGLWLRDVCEENGLFITSFGEENGNFNFAASLYPLSDSLSNIILLNHIDVVEEGDSLLWHHPPWSGHISDTEIWGRGAFDNKGAAIMQLFSMLKFRTEMEAHGRVYNITLLSVSCEETQCGGGASYVAENFIETLNPVIIIGEGATELSTVVGQETSYKQFGISVAQKRPFWLRLRLSISTSGHGSVPPDEYANKELILALSRLFQMKQPAIFNEVNTGILKILGENERGIQRCILKHPLCFKMLIVPQLKKQPELFALYSNTMTLSIFDSKNSTINNIPGTAEAYLDCRLMPEYSTEEFLHSVKKALNNEEIEISVIHQTNEIPVSDRNGKFYIHMKESIEEVYPGAYVYPIMLPNFNDVVWFRQQGIQGLSIIPVELSEDHLKCIHSENERIPILALYQGIETYSRFLGRCMSE